MAYPKYQTKELLNKVLNSGEDALKVDIDNVTLKTEGSDINIEVHTDKAEDSMLMFSNTTKDGSGTSYVPLIDSDGHLQVDALSTALPSGAATAANQSTIIGHVDGIETLITSTNTKLDTLETTANAQETLLTGIDADTDAIKTSLDNIDNAVDGNYLNVNMNLAGSDAQAGEGTISATTQRVTIATDDDGVAHLATIAGAVSTQMQVDVVAISAQSDGTYIGDIKFGESLPAGSAAIGKLAANSGVDIGDVDVTSIVPGTGATNLGKAIQSTQGSTDTGVAALAVRNDALADLSGADGDYTPLQVNKTGALNVTENTGYLGAIFEDGTDNITSKKVIAIQFIEDTTFTTLTPVDSSYIGTASGNGDAIDTSNTFPQGMTIFGRWTGFRLASGTIVAYQGDW